MLKPVVILASLAFALPAAAQKSDMSFFITSTGSGKGADFGGLEGADKHCQSLAQAAGAGDKKWRAYLSTQGDNSVNARDRIGKGPWRNAKGEVVAKSVDDLHADPNINKQAGLDEKAQTVNARGDSPNKHDILTGSQRDGTAFPPGNDRTCGNWTKSGEGSAFVGHHDRMGLRDDDASRSWNSSHASRGCSDEALRSSGGAGLIYCFAAD
jgi:hypothetical protein